MSTSTSSQVTPEEKDFIFSQWPEDQTFDDCVVCGAQIDSELQRKHDGIDVCAKHSTLAGAA